MIADHATHERDRAVVVEIPPGRDVGQEEVVLDEGGEHGDVVSVEPDARADRRHDLHADRAVVARVALADVVEERTEDEQVRAGHAVDEVGRFGRGLPQVPVDREPVVGVALGPAAVRGPLGDQVHPQTAMVERLDHRDGGAPAQQQLDEELASFRRPRRGERDRVVGQPFERMPIDALAPFGRRCRHAQHQRRVSARIGVRAEVHAELVGEHPVAEVLGRHERPPLVAGPRLLRLDPLPHLVADERDRPGGAGDLRHEARRRRQSRARRRRRPAPAT